MEIQKGKILIALGLLFALGVILAMSNAYCAINMGHIFSPLLYGVALAGLAVGASIVLLFRWKIDKMQLNKIITILPEDEKKVLNALIDKKSVSQTELRYLTNLTKLQVSRVVARLELRKIVEKKPYGNTNLIVLKI